MITNVAEIHRMNDCTTQFHPKLNHTKQNIEHTFQLPLPTYEAHSAIAVANAPKAAALRPSVLRYRATSNLGYRSEFTY